jgi:acetyltransferase
VAESERGGERSIVAVGRLNRTSARDRAEFALLLADAYQGQGLGSAMLKRLLEVGRAEGIRRVTAEIASDNGPMQAVCKKLGFRIEDEIGEPTLKAVLQLPA